MTIEEAREYWCRRLERAEGYSDEHWDAEERHAHADYVDAMKYAITALTVCIEHKKPKSNADRIRQMTDEELAEFFCRISECCGNDACMLCPIFEGCAQNVMCVERWLKQEVKDDAGSD